MQWIKVQYIFAFYCILIKHCYHIRETVPYLTRNNRSKNPFTAHDIALAANESAAETYVFSKYITLECVYYKSDGFNDSYII
jgi:hypothetical protein